jgi:hypothetical protein
MPKRGGAGWLDVAERDSGVAGLNVWVREKRELTGGVYGSMREERGGDEIGRSKQKWKTHFCEDANDTWAKWASWAERQHAVEGWAGSADWARP